MMQRKSTKRIVAWVALIATLFVVLFSAVYISENMAHHCDGEDCPICETLHQCTNIIKTIGSAVVIVATSILSIFYVKEILKADTDCVLCNSLIIQKVRMNN